MSADEPTDYERLVRFVVAPGPRFGLAVARCTDVTVREGLMLQATLDAEAAAVAVGIVDLAGSGPDADLVKLWASAASEPGVAGEVGALFIKNLDHLLIEPIGTPRSTQAIEDLNRRRDALPDAVPARVVIWLSDPAADALAQVARDLYDVILTFFRFDSPAPFRVITPHETVPAWLYAAQPEEQARLKREAAILESVVNRPDPQSRTVADSLARLGQIHLLLGDASRGESLLHRATEAFRHLGDGAREASVLLHLGDASSIRGNLDLAERYYAAAREIFERLGDVRARAVTLGRIADILQARGQLDDALRIYQQDVLPVFERLGDVRARAVTLGQIADILQARGQLDEALRIRQQDVLPVFEHLGDVRARAVERANLAVTLVVRDREKDRGAAAELLRLALADAEKLHLPEADRIRAIIERLKVDGGLAAHPEGRA